MNSGPLLLLLLLLSQRAHSATGAEQLHGDIFAKVSARQLLLKLGFMNFLSLSSAIFVNKFQLKANFSEFSENFYP